MQTNTAIVIGNNGRDLEEYGTPAFPAAAYEVCLRKTPLGFYDAHWHSQLHIMYAAQGSSVRVTTETQPYDLHDGDAILLGSGALHSVYPVKNHDSTFVSIMFHKKMISGFPGSTIERDLVLPCASFREILLRTHTQAHAGILQHITNGFSAILSTAPAHEMVFCLEMMAVWAGLHEQGLLQAAIEDASPAGSDRAKAMLTFLCENYADDLKLDDITGAANICRSQGSRLFKACVGKTIFEYLLHFRIEKSIELLEKTDHTISHIAYDTGFCSASHYIERFRQVTGYSPGEYRKRLIETP